MKKTFAHISVAVESDIGVPALLTRVEAHEENWEASTTAPQIYETTIELQKAGVDQRWIAGCEYRTDAGTFSVFAAGTRIETELKRGLSVRETASRLGFSSRQQFARSFRTVTGCAPSLQ
jgi:AraC-like DNA-binding protein